MAYNGNITGDVSGRDHHILTEASRLTRDVFRAANRMRFNAPNGLRPKRAARWPLWPKRGFPRGSSFIGIHGENMVNTW